MKEYVTYNPEIAREICEIVSCTTKGIKRLCRENSHWPHHSNIYRWCYDHKEFRDSYARAKAMQSEWLVEEALEIAYDGSHDTYIDEKGRERCDHEWVNRSRLKIDTIKWFASKLAPKIYGDKVQVETTNLNEDPEIKKARSLVDTIKSDNDGRDNTTQS